MNKIFAIVITLAMLLSLGAVLVSAEVPNVPWTPGNFAVADSAEFSTVGTVKIQWDADAASKLDLSDGDMTDWADAGYESITIDASNMVSWVGGAADAIDPGMPANWNITTYFVADSEWLYIGFYVTDPNFCYGSGNGYDGDAFQICIDFGGKLGQAVQNDPDSLTNPKNIFYSFSCAADGAPIQIMRQESDQDGWISEANGDGVKGAARKTEAGWSAEFAMSFQQLFDDFEWKIWEEDKKIYVGGENNDPLKIGCCLYYLDRTTTGEDPLWAAGTSNGQLLEDGTTPGVSWTCYDNGINLELDITEEVTFDYDEKIVILPSGETAPPEEDKDEETDPVVDDETDAPTAAPTDEATNAPTEAPTQGGDDTTDEGCASIVGFGAAAVLAAAAAAFVLKKKD